ncbi:hypothetical protein CDAR_248711 [Caerostris darwini]|uniref:Uncharacterized protein n=1 Tax=Caerostris darwini TaxID=1538125 RepID=A0AAV4MSR1_9ARAC|nr:hypothetical protein CDAR_248711 [Caerostris darwini]
MHYRTPIICFTWHTLKVWKHTMENSSITLRSPHFIPRDEASIAIHQLDCFLEKNTLLAHNVTSLQQTLANLISGVSFKSTESGDECDKC